MVFACAVYGFEMLTSRFAKSGVSSNLMSIPLIVYNVCRCYLATYFCWSDSFIVFPYVFTRWV